MDVGANDTAVDELVELLDNLYSSYILQNNTAQLTAAIPSNLFNNDSQLIENARGFFMKNFQSIMKVKSRAVCNALRFYILWKQILCN